MNSALPGFVQAGRAHAAQDVEHRRSSPTDSPTDGCDVLLAHDSARACALLPQGQQQIQEVVATRFVDMPSHIHACIFDHLRSPLMHESPTVLLPPMLSDAQRNYLEATRFMNTGKSKPGEVASDTAIAARVDMLLDAHASEAARVLHDEPDLRAYVLDKHLPRLHGELHRRIVACGRDERSWHAVRDELPRLMAAERPMPRNLAIFLARELVLNDLSSERRVLAVTALAARIPASIPDAEKERLLATAIRQAPKCDDRVRLALYRLMREHAARSHVLKRALVEILPKIKSRCERSITRIATQHVLPELMHVVHADDSDHSILASAALALHTIAQESKTKPVLLGQLCLQLVRNRKTSFNTLHALIVTSSLVPGKYHPDILRAGIDRVNSSAIGEELYAAAAAE